MSFPIYDFSYFRDTPVGQSFCSCTFKVIKPLSLWYSTSLIFAEATFHNEAHTAQLPSLLFLSILHIDASVFFHENGLDHIVC